eukprot:TRINITY_DN6672_c0_g1_i1.p1 TRINITY_DN6672_c0_g1~~TRINITY_DN6672_c0_g1_i1.p1  ORF type:complete len:285 (+),score=46.74 TRINITY_DN6672_c0_g1_i1:163-1017(+)
MSILLGASRSAARIVVLTAPRVVNWRSPTVSAHSARSVGINWREASQAWQQLSKVSPVSQCRLFHSSTQIWKKGTQEKRASRLANAAGVNPDSAEFATLQQLLKQAQEQQQKEKAKESAEVEVTLFEIDRQKLFIFATGACILIFVLFLGTAEFMFNWYMTMDETTGELVEAPFWTRLRWATFFSFVGVFLLVTRWFWGTRFINQIDLLPANKFRISTYSFWGRKKSQVFDIADILPNHVNVSPAYYTFKFTGNALYHMVDRGGRVADEAKLLSLLQGKLTNTK